MAFNTSQWKRERGSSRGYVNTQTGERLSRRQYDKIKGVRHKSQAELQVNRRGQSKYQSLLRDYVRYKNEQGIPITRGEARKSDIMKQIVKDLKLKRGENPADPAVNARRVAALKAVGRRRGIPDHIVVGESPK